MARFELNGIELELNMLDADVVDKFEELNKEVLNTVNDPKLKEMKTSDSIRAMCKAVDKMFDGLFGVGTAEALFGLNSDFMKRLECYDAVISKSKTNVTDSLSNIQNKYSPNRAQRRNGKHKRR